MAIKTFEDIEIELKKDDDNFKPAFRKKMLDKIQAIKGGTVTETFEQVFAEFKKQKSKKRQLPVDVTQEELLRIVKVCRFKHHKLAYFLAWYTGCRISEVLNLEPRDINWKEGTILVRQGKNSKDRVVPLPDAFIEPMCELMPIKKICKSRALQKAFKKDCAKCGLLTEKPSVHFHSLRHGCATHCLEKGIDITEIKMLLGHANIATTDRYTHLRPIKMLNSYREKF